MGTLSRSNWNYLEVLVFEERGKREYLEKNLLRARMTTNNKLNPHMPLSPGIKPGRHWWEASALTPFARYSNFIFTAILSERKIFSELCRGPHYYPVVEKEMATTKTMMMITEGTLCGFSQRFMFYIKLQVPNQLHHSDWLQILNGNLLHHWHYSILLHFSYITQLWVFFACIVGGGDK